MKEKIFRRKNSVDTLTDTTTVKKDSAIEVDKLIVFFSLYYIVQLNTVFLKFVLVKRKFA